MLENLFNPQGIALIGASHSEGKLGGVILENLLQYGRDRIYPVNPHYDELAGIRCYRQIKDLPDTARLAVIVRPAPEVPGIIRELAGKSKCAVIISAGFTEAGRADLQEELKRAATEAGIRVLGPNCLGMFYPANHLDTSFLPPGRPVRPKSGNLGVTSQSGSVMGSIYEALASSNTGVSKTVHYGNAADIDEGDLYDYFCQDSETGVVISYIESVGDGRRFVEKAATLASKKPLLILKAGKGTSGVKAAYSHTGRLAGSYEIFSSILSQFHIREAQDFESLIDSAKALSYQVPEKKSGRKVLILTNGGGDGVLSSDQSFKEGLELTALSEEKGKKFKEIFPPFYTVGNPFDFTAESKDEDYGTVLSALKDDYDGFLVIALTVVEGITEGIVPILKNFRENVRKPIVFLTGTDAVGLRIAKMAEAAGIPAYPTPERAVRALRGLLG